MNLVENYLALYSKLLEQERKEAEERKRANPFSRFIYAFGVDDDPNSESGLMLIINTIECWRTEQCIVDGYTYEEQTILDPFLLNNELYELSESFFEIPTHLSMEILTGILNQTGFSYDPEFQQWLNELQE